jgi:hypothetical protein
MLVSGLGKLCAPLLKLNPITLHPIGVREVIGAFMRLEDMDDVTIDASALASVSCGQLSRPAPHGVITGVRRHHGRLRRRHSGKHQRAESDRERACIILRVVLSNTRGFAC